MGYSPTKINKNDAITTVFTTYFLSVPDFTSFHCFPKVVLSISAAADYMLPRKNMILDSPCRYLM